MREIFVEGQDFGSWCLGANRYTASIEHAVVYIRSSGVLKGRRARHLPRATPF